MSNRIAITALAVMVVASTAAPNASAQSKAPLIGRWDLVLDGPGTNKAGWLEVRHSGRSTLVGNVMISVGSSRPIAKVEFDNGSFKFAVPPQWDDAEGENTVVGTLKGDSITGTLTFANGKKVGWRGARAPTLRRASAPSWGAPQPLLNGKDLSGWKTVAGGANQWLVENGVLRSPKSGSNLMTEKSFTDFKLHVEFRYPAGSNSGIYLRGRYETQVEDTESPEPQIDGLGAIYGHIAPNQNAAKKAGEWQTYDITLVGRTVTVVLNGKTVVSEREIPGPTGGALDSNEGAPGPLFLQGDHGPIEYRNIVITPAR
ncbi:MAG: DUF1080 domain-containing protein [Gemmatimonadaceae bacterium]